MTFPSFKTIDTKIDRQSRIQFGRVHFGVFSTSCLAPHLGLDVVVHMWVQFWRVLLGSAQFILTHFSLAFLSISSTQGAHLLELAMQF